MTGAQRLIYGGMVGLALITGLIALRYLLPDTPGAAQPVLANRFADPALALHAAFGGVALIIGPFQFLPRLRVRHTRAHRAIGVSYVVSVAVSGLAGLVLALGVISGPAASMGFALLALAWLGTTGLAVRAVAARRFAIHRRWMVRSFALTLAGVSLRVQLVLAGTAGMTFEASYPVIAFACWIPNLVLAELWLRRRALAQPAPA